MANRDKRDGAPGGKESRSRKESQGLGPSDRDSRGPQGPPSQDSSGQSDRERQGTQGSERSQGRSGEGNDGRFEGGSEPQSGSSRGQSDNPPFDEDEDESE